MLFRSLRDLGNQRLIPRTHIEFLMQLKEQGVNPKVVYDIGACVLHWTNEAERIWPDTKYIAFEAMDASEFLFKEKGMNYSIGVLSDRDGKEVEFYCNEYHPGGNSYYKENEVVNPDTVNYFGDHNKRKMIAMTLDSVVAFKGFPAPDFIKMDVQGAELDVLKGAQNTLKSVQHVILECQSVEYNKGAPMNQDVIAYMDSIGFECLGQFSNNGPDGDYFFKRR